MMGELRELGELLHELWAVRRRLLPVVLGLCFGTLGLAVLLAFGDGFDAAMHAALHRSGEAMLRWYGGGSSRPFAGQPAGRPVPLTAREAQLLATAPGVTATSPEVQLDARVVAEDGVHDANVVVCAVGPQWAYVRGLEVRAGSRFLSPVDEAERRRVAVLGAELAARLFPTQDALGRSVRIFGVPFVVVGVLPEVPQLMGYGGDDTRKAVVPFATLQAIRGFRTVHYVLTRIAEPLRAAAAEREQRRLLARQLGFDPGDRAAVRVTNHALESARIGDIVLGTRVFLIVIGVLGLLVAALGVANMMFVIVEERVPEIGLRMAFGARPAQIRGRQLLETTAVVAIGGGLGLLLAAALLYGVNQVPMPTQAKGYLGEPLLSAITALAIAGVLGLCAGIAGWHPAARAAAVQPMEALRHE
jgi:putative ABC transport system permease protein